MVALLAGLKIAGILLTGIFAAINLNVDFKDKDGITPWGRRALIGAVGSMLIAALAQGLESYFQKRDSDTARARSSVLLNQVLRTTYSLRDMNVSACADVPLEHPRIQRIP